MPKDFKISPGDIILARHINLTRLIKILEVRSNSVLYKDLHTEHEGWFYSSELTRDDISWEKFSGPAEELFA